MSDTALLERDTAGLHVEVNWLPIMGTLALNVRCDDWSRGVFIPNDKAFDAFNHPFSYLPDIPPAFMSPSVRAGLKGLTEDCDAD